MTQNNNSNKISSMVVQIDNFLEKIYNSLGYIIGFLIVFLTMVIFTQVILRYVFRTSIRQLIILVRFSISWITFLGTAYALKSNDHLEIDIFPSSTPDWIIKLRQVIIDIATFFVVFMFIRVGIHAFQTGFSKAELVDRRITQGYYYSALLVSAILMMVFLLWILIKRYLMKIEEIPSTKSCEKSELDFY